MSEAAEILSRSLVHQIERLTAERDALRAELATYETQFSEIHVERANLRAELDAERAWKRANVELAEQAVALRAERDALRVELAYERERARRLEADGLAKYERIHLLEAERFALLGLLREAHVKMVENNLWRNLRARIAAALKGDRDE